MAASLPAGGASSKSHHDPVLLGYQDEEIRAEFASQVDFKTSKIGGQPVRPQRTNGLDIISVIIVTDLVRKLERAVLLAAGCAR